MLRDTAHIAESDATFVNRHHPGEEPVEPLFTMADADATMPLFRPVAYRTPTKIAGDLTMESYDAGHILGSAANVFTDGKIKLAYSGDVGRPGLPIIRDPEPLPPVDYLIMESTYGSRVHPQQGEALARLEDVVKRTIGRGGRLIIPSFAVGRTQQIVLLLHQLINEQRIPAVPMFVDSPLAVDVTKTFRAHPECFDAETVKYLQNGEDPFPDSSASSHVTRRGRLEKTERPAWAICGDLTLGNVRSRAHTSSSAAQYWRSKEYGADHRLPG